MSKAILHHSVVPDRLKNENEDLVVYLHPFKYSSTEKRNNSLEGHRSKICQRLTIIRGRHENKLSNIYSRM